jgi:hypothetical protein
MAFTRSATLLCFVAHLLLHAAAVPHFHEAGDGTPNHEHRSCLHIHLGGHGHHHDLRHGHHVHHGTVTVADAPGDGAIAAPASCCCHDDDAIDVRIDPLLATPERRAGGLESEHRAPLGLPEFVVCFRVSPSPACRRGGSLRPPGDHAPTVHDLLPHMLRI